ncbi:MAG: SpoIIE family protein phosphatase [Ignavibacteriae bacterium]|nr:SpoIIE family protein phosphatase [Ignavibacteriota bacterium]MCB9215565.1 SpoIIE family protein phosphatase [Ignavibacteria bacterium]
MKRELRGEHETIWGLPDLQTTIILAVTTFGWVVLGFFDWLFGFGTGADEHGWFRTLLPLLLLLPIFFRWFRPTRKPVDHQDAYRLHGSTILTALAILGILVLFSLFPISFNSSGGPEEFSTFIIGRLIGLILLCSVALLTENLLLLLSYGNRVSPSIVDALRYGLVFTIISAALIPGAEAREIVSSILASIVGLGLFLLSLRSGWVVHIWRDQKYRMLGLSFLGILAGAGLSTLIAVTPVAQLLDTTSRSITMLGHLFASIIIITQFGLFIRIFLTLPTAGAMDRRNIEVSSLSNFGRLMVDSFDMNDLMKVSVSIACDVTSARSAWIELIDNDTREIITGGKVPLNFEEIDKLLNLNIDGQQRPLGKITKPGEGVRIFNFTFDNSSNTNSGSGAELRKRLSSGSLAVVPLRNNTGEGGILYVVKGQKNGFDRDDTAILETVATQIALAMEHAALIRKSIERERLRNEMLIAREAQQRLLPQAMPESHAYELYAESEPASMVGGDYFDSVIFRDGTKGALIADVSGKGAGAALYMGMVKGVVRALSGICADPAELLTKANSALYRNIDPRFFVTMTCLRLREEEQIVQIARAGHCPTLILRNSGEAVYHTPQGIGLALTSTKQFQRALRQEDISCSSGDMILLFSDGLAEAQRIDGEEIGYEKFRRMVQEVGINASKGTLREFRDAIFAGISTFTENAPPVDDSTVVILRWR